MWTALYIFTIIFHLVMLKNLSIYAKQNYLSKLYIKSIFILLGRLHFAFGSRERGINELIISRNIIEQLILFVREDLAT